MRKYWRSSALRCDGITAHPDGWLPRPFDALCAADGRGVISNSRAQGIRAGMPNTLQRFQRVRFDSQLFQWRDKASQDLCESDGQCGHRGLRRMRLTRMITVRSMRPARLFAGLRTELAGQESRFLHGHRRSGGDCCPDGMRNSRRVRESR